jgi:hypothetical protein
MHVAGAHGHARLQRTAAHLVHQPGPIGPGRVIADLDREQAAWEGLDVGAVVKLEADDQGDADSALVRDPDRSVRQRRREPVLETR